MKRTYQFENVEVWINGHPLHTLKVLEIEMDPCVCIGCEVCHDPKDCPELGGEGG